VAAAGGGSRRLHNIRVSAQQRIHLAALLILLAVPLNAADISFDPRITKEEFTKFSRIAAQGIFASPVQPARAAGLLGFDVGIAVTGVPVDRDATYWQRAAGNDFSSHGYLLVPRVVASKGFSAGTISGSYAKVSDSGIKTWGGALDVPIIEGGVLRPTLAARATYSVLTGSDVYDLKTYGAELFLSKGFGPVTPYGAIGRVRGNAHGTIPATTTSPEVRLSDKSDQNRYTVGVRFSLFIPKIVVEATQGEVRSYAAKISLGL
jgi:hypothetical protein